MIPYLAPFDPFPPVETAQEEMGGLLAVGADLSPDRLLDAYRRGIFPWGTVESYPLWYSPDPRMVLFPEEFRLTRSLRKTLRSGRFEVRFDHDFPAVIAACSAMPRPGQDGTWISTEIVNAYTRLHELGHAHSAEAWLNGELAGGLYGIRMGNFFFGESMFSRHPNASKFAFISLVRQLASEGVQLIDCQVYTPHLESLGARMIAREDFIERLKSIV